jgi:hypothetical protein
MQPGVLAHPGLPHEHAGMCARPCGTYMTQLGGGVALRVDNHADGIHSFRSYDSTLTAHAGPRTHSLRIDLEGIYPCLSWHAWSPVQVFEFLSSRIAERELGEVLTTHKFLGKQLSSRWGL